MSDLSDYDDEQIIAEANERAKQGRWSPDRFISQLQSDDRAKLGILRSAIIEAWLKDTTHPGLASLHLLCDKLDGIHGNPLPERAYAINTTHYGKDPYQDHSPK